MYKTLGVAVTFVLVATFAACGGSTSNNTDVVAGDDAGGGDDSGGTGDDAGQEAASTAVVCTSKTTWTRGDRGSSLMHPGRACITCHDANGGPSLTIAGTVFPTLHEPDDCNGVNGTTAGMTVVITDANNQSITINVNSAGNFFSQQTIAMPFHAKVVSGGKSRSMVAAQTTGDCNSCHTVQGTNSAPGRIQAP
jgi:hypothetical protein